MLLNKKNEKEISSMGKQYTEKEIQDILNVKRKMSKIEFLAFCKFTNISDDFFNGSKQASTQEERRIVNFIANKKAHSKAETANIF